MRGHRLGRMMAPLAPLVLLALLLGACRASDPPPVARDFSLVIPVYNPLGLEYARSRLAPYLAPNDRFMIVSGNTDSEVDVAWIDSAAAALRASYPDAGILAATSGLENLAEVARGVRGEVEGIVYIYEPNFPNQPEFTWDFGTTLDLFSEADARVRTAGLRTIGKPTGRPILQRDLQRYAWDYGKLATTVDELFIQTQTYCEDGLRTFRRALDAVSGQYGAYGAPLGWFPQITVDPEAPNGTSVAQALACARLARERGLPGTVLWWSPAYVEHTVAFLERLNAPYRGPL